MPRKTTRKRTTTRKRNRFEARCSTQRRRCCAAGEGAAGEGAAGEGAAGEGAAGEGVDDGEGADGECPPVLTRVVVNGSEDGFCVTNGARTTRLARLTKGTLTHLRGEPARVSSCATRGSRSAKSTDVEVYVALVACALASRKPRHAV